MPRRGDTYIVELKKTHIEWGTYRHTSTRTEIEGEAYVPIPREVAQDFAIMRGDEYEACFADGFPSFTCKAAGNIRKDDAYAKQFQGSGDLKAFGRWFEYAGAAIGDSVKVTFADDATAEFELLKAHG